MGNLTSTEDIRPIQVDPGPALHRDHRTQGIARPMNSCLEFPFPSIMICTLREMPPSVFG